MIIQWEVTNTFKGLDLIECQNNYGILIPACASSSPAFLMMYSAYKLNKLGDNVQP